jgi:hypothetical protein
VLGTQVAATLIAVYGLFMTPLGWGWAGFVWGYALLWFLVNDRVKLLAYRVFDPTAVPLLVKESVDVTLIIKFFVHLSAEEHQKRFLQRIDEPDKN